MYDELYAKLARYGPQHVLRSWDELSDNGRCRLAAQIEAVDLSVIDRLARGLSESHDWAALARKAKPPRANQLGRTMSAGDKTEEVTAEAACALGETALAAGEVGVLLVAGGQGTRLGFDHPKGMYPIGPVSGASILQIHIEKVRAIAARYDVHVPLYLMTSPATHDETVTFLDENGRFGQPAEDLVVFCQGTMPAVDAATGKLLLADRDSLFVSPDGHGGTIAALAKSGAIDDAHRRGLKHVFYLQVDNPLVPICNAEFIGRHILCKSGMSSLAIRKKTPHDKVGNFVLIDGRLQIIEYSDFPDDVCSQREVDGSLTFWAGSVAIHVFEVAFLDRILTMPNALPFHVANKKVPHLDDNGELFQPTEPNALKFERFIFDLLPIARNPIVVEASEEAIFAPLKNAPGAANDTAAHVQSRMLAQYRRWIEESGAEVADGASIEISPLFALDEQDVKKRFERGIVFDGKQYLEVATE